MGSQLSFFLIWQTALLWSSPLDVHLQEQYFQVYSIIWVTVKGKWLVYWWDHLKYRDLQCDIHNVWLQEPVKIENNKYFCCCCCKSGPLTLVTCLPARGYVSGQIIPMTIEVDNASKVPVSYVVCELLQVGIISLN